MSRTRVVVVEDDRADAALIRHHLAEPGWDEFEVECVDHLEALGGVQAHDAVLLDLSLPDSSGVDTIRRARELTRAPIVVLTGFDDAKLEHDVLTLGASDFLSKSDITGRRHRQLRRTIAYAVYRSREANLAELEIALAREMEHHERLVTLGRLAAGIAHEINNPLAYLRGNLEVLRDTIDEVVGAPMDAARAEEVCAEMRSMIDDGLHAVRRISKAAQTYRTFGALDAADLAPRALDDIARDAARFVETELGADVELELALMPIPEISLSVERVTNVVVNLLHNANHALTEHGGGRIRLATRKVGSLAHLVVEDDGPGIPAEERHRVFEPFFTTNARAGGTGLGLHLSSETARLHGGHLALDESTAHGARFVLTLPLTRRTEATTGQRGGEGRGARVLIIDDEPAILRAYARLLAGRHEVVTAEGGMTAIELLGRDDGFDVVLCDIMMPGHDAVDIVDCVLESHEHLLDRLLFVTAGAMSPRTQSIHERFKGRVLFKPVTRDMLDRAIDAVLLSPTP